jgi:hypothetical protein
LDAVKPTEAEVAKTQRKFGAKNSADPEVDDVKSGKNATGLGVSTQWIFARAQVIEGLRPVFYLPPGVKLSPRGEVITQG